jgi:hypothetical protein
MATADDDPIEIVIVTRTRVEEMEARLDTRWTHGMKWPRCPADEADFCVAERMIRAGSNFYGLKHLQPLRELLESVAKGG